MELFNLITKAGRFELMDEYLWERKNDWVLFNLLRWQFLEPEALVREWERFDEEEKNLKLF
jgi:hypothetical protein